MSLLGDLLGVGGSIYGSQTIADATRDAANTTASAQKAINQNTLDFVAGGSVDAYGNIINRRDPATGALTTTPTGPVKDLTNQLLSNQTKAAGARGDLGDVAKRGVADFSGFTGTGGRPDFSRADATAITTADDQRLLQSLVNPALNNAAILDNRRLGGTSNAGNIVGKTMKEILPQVKIGGETRALDLKNQMDKAFIANTLGISDQALNQIAQGPQTTVPGVANAGEMSGLANALKVTAPTAAPNLGSAALAQGVQSLGNVINKNEAQQTADARQAAADAQNKQVNDLLMALYAQRLKMNEPLPASNATP